MSVNSKDFANPQYLTGSFTSAGSPAAVSETLPFQPKLVICFIDVEGTNPNMLVGVDNSTTDSMLTTGSTGVITTPAVASGLDITTTGFSVAAAGQVASGKNFWIAFR